MKKLLLSQLIFLLAITLSAQIPHAFKYQAIVRDLNGNIFSNKSVEIILSILEGSENGSVVYSESFNVNTNQYGLLNIEVGNGTELSGNFENINWSENSYFLKSEIDFNDGVGYILMGTSELLSVPYALYSEFAGNVPLSDTSSTNELQSLSIDGNNLSISNGNAVIIPVSTTTDSSGLLNLTTENCFIGSQSGSSNTTGTSNIFIGTLSGSNSSSGKENIFIGVGSGLTSQNGNNNVFIGYLSGYNNTDGYRNVYVGTNSGQFGTGAIQNSFLGNYSGYSNITGINNTFLGNECGSSNTIGNSNVYIGNSAGSNNQTGNYNVFIGNQAGKFELESNKLYIENSSNDLSSALIYGDFHSNELRFNARVSIGASPDTNYSLYLSGSAYSTVGWYSPSDIRWKKNIIPYESALDKIHHIRAVSFNWKKEEYSDENFEDKNQIGVIAQEVKKYIPELVKENEDGLLNVDYSKLSVILLAAVKEQQTEIDKLKEELLEIKKYIAETRKK